MELTSHQYYKLKGHRIYELDNEKVVESRFGEITMYMVADHSCTVASVYGAMDALDSISNAVIDECRDWIAVDEFLGCAIIKFKDTYKYKCRMLGMECPDTALYLFGTIHGYGGILEDIRIKV